MASSLKVSAAAAVAGDASGAVWFSMGGDGGAGR